jgi:D-arabinose 1-dehydrogenase-like Zn-dependent alcohol dehydrogenase
MKALVLEDARTLTTQIVDDPVPTPGGALVTVMANGVCRSDWHAWTGHQYRPFPFVLGHEMTGVIEEVTPGVTRFRKGDRVIVPFAGYDGTCSWCQRGQSHLCENITVPGKHYSGGYAQYVAVPDVDRNLVRLPDEIPFADAAALGCRFMTAYHGVMDRARATAGEWVAVFGCGGIGLSAINIAAAAGCRVIGVDVNQGNLDIAKRMGAIHTIDSSQTAAADEIVEITGGGADLSIDALGIGPTCVPGILSLRKQGRHLQIGITQAKDAGYLGVPIDVIVYKELQLIGTLGMPTHRFDTLLAMVTQGLLTPGRMISREIGLDDVNAVFEGMSRSDITGTYVVTDFS